MESVRLTKALRKKMLASLLKRKYAGEDGQLITLIKEAAKLADEIYLDVLGEKNLKIMASLPTGWLQETNYLQVELGGEFTWVNFNGAHIFKIFGIWELRNLGLQEYSAEIFKPIPGCYIRGAAKYDGAHSFTSRFRSLQNRMENLTEEYERDRQEANAALCQFSTSKRLLTEWPEIEAIFYDCYGVKPVRDLVKVVDLNAKFDLPVRELEAA